MVLEGGAQEAKCCAIEDDCGEKANPPLEKKMSCTMPYLHAQRAVGCARFCMECAVQSVVITIMRLSYLYEAQSNMQSRNGNINYQQAREKKLLASHPIITAYQIEPSATIHTFANEYKLF